MKQENKSTSEVTTLTSVHVCMYWKAGVYMSLENALFKQFAPFADHHS